MRDRQLTFPESLEESDAEYMVSRAAERWPDGLLERALRLRVPTRFLRGWLTGGIAPVDAVTSMLDQRERLIGSTLRVQVAQGRTVILAHAELTERRGAYHRLQRVLQSDALALHA